MMKRTRIVVATATLAALAATGTASAASGSAPAPGAPKSGSPMVKVEGKAKGDGKSKTMDADFAKIAAKLGVTTDRLIEALTAAKMSLATSNNPTPDAFIAAAAAELGLPVSLVQDALGPLFTKPVPAGNGHKKGKKGADDSPLTTAAAAAFVAAALGVDQAEAKAALAALESAPRGTDPESKAFADIAASLGVSPDRLLTALTDLKKSLVEG